MRKFYRFIHVLRMTFYFECLFQENHADSKTISKNAKDLFNIITNEKNRKNFLEDLKKFGVQLQSLLSDFEVFVNGTIHDFENMIQEMDKMFVKLIT